MNVDFSAKNAVLGLYWVSLIVAHPAQAQLVGDTWGKSQKQGFGTIVLTYIKAPAFTYQDVNGEISGICIDILKAFIDYIKQKKGVNIKAKLMPETINFNKFLNDVRTATGGVFGLGNITITDERKTQMSFTPPFINNLSFLITHNSIPTLGSMESIATHFQGMKAYTVKGTTNEQTILEWKQRYFPNLQIVYVNTSGAALTKVAADNRSFTCLDFNYFSEGIRLQSPIKRHPVGDHGSEKFGFIMPLGSDWQPLWDEFFVQYRFTKSVEYRKILIKHLGAGAVSALDRFKD